MELKQALDLFEMDKSSSEEEFKSKYREFTKKYHPDIYKEDPNKFKEINIAYDLIKDYKKNPNKYDNPNFNQGFNPFSGFGININDIFNQQHRQSYVQHIQVKTTISFKEAVLGTEKEIEYDKNVKCNDCDGQGSSMIKNDCKHCDGFGRSVSQTRGMIFTRGCDKCNGEGVTTKECKSCNSTGSKSSHIKASVNIPSGVVNNATLGLRGAGHFAGSSMLGESYSDVYLTINVIPDDILTMEGSNVILNIDIPLIDALTGCEKEVKTIFGTKNINIPSLSKNKDSVILPNLGVKSANGSQVVILNIKYPDNVNDLIEYLKQKTN